MKNKHLYISIISLCFAAMALTACNEVINEHIKLDVASADFLGANNEPLTVKVASTPSEFTVHIDSADENWITVDTKSDSFTVTVEDNDTNYNRSGIITIKAGNAVEIFTVYQDINDTESCIFRKVRLAESRISPSGNYVGGFKFVLTDEGVSMWQVEITEVLTDKKIYFDPVDEGTMSLRFAYCMTDQGQFFVDTALGDTWIFDINTMDYTKIPVPSESTDKPNIHHTSVDGKTWVGASGFGSIRWPMVWKDGEPSKLDRPTKSFRDGNPHYGVIARGCSADGSIIYGTSWEGFDAGLVWWKNGELMGYAGGTDVDTGEQIHYVSDEKAAIDMQQQYITNGLSLQSQTYSASLNGKYIAAMYRVETKTESGTEPGVYPAFFNTETNQTKVFRDLNGSGFTVSNNGIGFTTEGTLQISSGYVVNVETGEILGKINEWLQKEYGIIPVIGVVEHVNQDMSVIYGANMESNAMGVSMMNWYIAPPIKK